MRTDFGKREEGAALIEAALVLPILLLLIFAVADISIYYWNIGLAGKAVQLGVRQAIVSDAVAVGPGLDPAQSASYWDGLPPGLRCSSGSTVPDLCPQFEVVCDLAAGCRCIGGGCRFTFAPAKLTPILEAMRAVLPGLGAQNVQVSYATNGLGYVGRPIPVPVNVGVSLLGLSYEANFIGPLIGSTIPLRASALLPSEDLSRR